MEQLPYKRMLVRTLVTDKGEHQLMYVDLTGDRPIIEPFGGIERHSTVFIDGRVTLLQGDADSMDGSIANASADKLLPYLLD